jgi:hypothetical protein
MVRTEPFFKDFLTWCHDFGIESPFKLKVWPKIWDCWCMRRDPGNWCNDRRDYYRNVYLKTDHWKQLKKEMLQANPTCRLCNSPSKLDVHHRHYRSLYNVTLDDLIVLCRRCHADLHDTIKEMPVSLLDQEALLDENLKALIEKRTGRSRLNHLMFRLFRATKRQGDRHGVLLARALRQRLSDKRTPLTFPSLRV